LAENPYCDKTAKGALAHIEFVRRSMADAAQEEERHQSAFRRLGEPAAQMLALKIKPSLPPRS
jgi:hypothetical protein